MPEVSLITSVVLGPQTTSATRAWDEAREGVPEPLPYQLAVPATVAGPGALLCADAVAEIASSQGRVVLGWACLGTSGQVLEVPEGAKRALKSQSQALGSGLSSAPSGCMARGGSSPWLSLAFFS